jgi:hypothetical protein
LRLAVLGGLSPLVSTQSGALVTTGGSRPGAPGPDIAPATPALFEEVPAAASGIAWRHENALSRDRYLPETVGAGCAVFDYDNDGWMDIYLVNSGPCDFYQPPRPLRNALYKNNRDGTFSEVTEVAGVGAARSAWE